MAYLDDEQSVDESAPVELYSFVGTYSSYHYTSGPEAVDYNGDTYLPIAIERSEVKAGTQDDDGLDISVKMAVYQQVVVDYGFTLSPPKLTLTIYRVQPTGVAVYWTGPVNNITSDEDGRASLRCPSVLGNALVGNVPNVYYQTPCNNVLFDARCKVDEALFTNVSTISAIAVDDPKNITVASIGALDGKLIGGELALDSGERRMIVSQVGTVLRVNFPFNTIDLGGGCIIAAGCDHLYRGDCKLKFDNQINFNGFMFIPPDNPFVDGIDPGAEGVADTACVFDPGALPIADPYPWFYKVWVDIYNTNDGGEVRNDGAYNLDRDGANVGSYVSPTDPTLGTPNWVEWIGGRFGQLTNYGIHTGGIWTIRTDGPDRPLPSTWRLQEQHSILIRPAGNGLYNIPGLVYDIYIKYNDGGGWTLVGSGAIGGVAPHYTFWDF